MGSVRRFEIAVIGGGPVGLTTALLLARLNIETVAIFPPPPLSGDRRTAALFAGSIELLRNLDVWRQLAPHGAPMFGIRILDDRGALLRAPEALFRAAEHGLTEFGFNVPNAAILSALTAAAASMPALTVIHAAVAELIHRDDDVLVRTMDGQDIAAGLIAGADGRNSLVRRSAGITSRAWDYPQSATVCAFEHDRPHHGISTEFHRANGPLTTVPMPGNASSLVWVDSRDEATHLADLSDAEFGQILETRLAGLLGTVSKVGPRGAFPLSGLSAQTMGQGRTVLLGEAAHVMPPIGAQGLNLGLRDAAVLAECVMTARGDARAAVASYARDRAPDVTSRIAAIDALNRSLLTDFLPVHLARGLGIFGLAAFAPLRRLVVREGLQPSLAAPRAMQPGGLLQLAALSTSRASPPSPAA